MSVYFAKVGRYIKVGFSENAERRVSRLWHSETRYTRPWDLSTTEVPELLLAIDGDKDQEAACHRALADYHSNAEWFVDEPGVREFMIRAAAGDLSPAVRPTGPFTPVPYERMSDEWRDDIDRMMARVARRSA